MQGNQIVLGSFRHDLKLDWFEVQILNMQFGFLKLYFSHKHENPQVVKTIKISLILIQSYPMSKSYFINKISEYPKSPHW